MKIILTLIILTSTVTALANGCINPVYFYVNSSIENKKDFDDTIIELTDLSEKVEIPRFKVLQRHNTRFQLEALNFTNILNNFLTQNQLSAQEKKDIFYSISFKMIKDGSYRVIGELLLKKFTKVIPDEVKKFLEVKDARRYLKVGDQVKKVDQFIEKIGPEVLTANQFEQFKNEFIEIGKSYQNSTWVADNEELYESIITDLINRNASPVFISRHDGTILINNILKQLRTGNLLFKNTNPLINLESLRRLYKCSGFLALDILRPNDLEFEMNKSGDNLKFETINTNKDDIRDIFTSTTDYEYRIKDQILTDSFSKQYFSNIKNLLELNPSHKTSDKEKYGDVGNSIISPLDIFKREIFSITGNLNEPQIKDIKFEDIRGNNLSELKADIIIEVINLPFGTDKLAEIEFKIDTNGDGISDCTRTNLSECTASNRDCQALKCKDVPIIDFKNSEKAKEFEIISFKPNEDVEIQKQKLPIAQSSGGMYIFNDLNTNFKFEFSGLDKVLYKYNNIDNNSNLVFTNLSDSNQDPNKNLVSISEQDAFSYIRGVGIDKNGLLNFFAAYPEYEFLGYTNSSDCDGENGSLFTKINNDGSTDQSNKVFLSDDILKAPIKQDINNSSLCSNTIVNTLDSSRISINGYVLKNTNITLSDGQGLFKLDSTNIGFNNEPAINGKYIVSNSIFNLPIRGNQSNIYNLNANFSGNDKDRFISINGSNFKPSSNTNINVVDSGISSFTINNSQFDGINNLNLKEIISSDNPVTSMIISDSSITRSNIENSKVNSSTITDIDISNSEVFISNISGDSVIIDSETFNSTISNSTINQSIIKSAQIKSSTIDESTIEIGSTINGSTLTSGSFTTFASVTDTTKEGVNYENIEIVNGEEVTGDPVN